MASPIGLEPMTYCLEGSYSIQLSYGDIKGGSVIIRPNKAHVAKSATSITATDSSQCSSHFRELLIL